MDLLAAAWIPRVVGQLHGAWDSNDHDSDMDTTPCPQQVVQGICPIMLA